MLRKKQTLAILVIWTSCLSACAHTQPVEVTTWLYESSTGLLMRRGPDGEQKLPKDQAHFYRCYSPEDDLIWRMRLASCVKE
jgi:hypothetical protein